METVLVSASLIKKCLGHLQAIFKKVLPDYQDTFYGAKSKRKEALLAHVFCDVDEYSQCNVVKVMSSCGMMAASGHKYTC